MVSQHTSLLAFGVFRSVAMALVLGQGFESSGVKVLFIVMTLTSTAIIFWIMTGFVLTFAQLYHFPMKPLFPPQVRYLLVAANATCLVTVAVWLVLIGVSQKESVNTTAVIASVVIAVAAAAIGQTTNNKQQATNNKQQTTNNKQQTTNNKQQTTNNKQQTTNQQTTKNQGPHLVPACNATFVEISSTVVLTVSAFSQLKPTKEPTHPAAPSTKMKSM
jgi:hypothetical protein